MSSFTIEVVASSVRSCISAEQGGAGRIELCAALATAGVTPSSGLLEAVKSAVSIPVFVMIRPREGNFCYERHELDVMKREIELLKTSGADGFVLGVLHEDGAVNWKNTRMLLDLCKPLPVTFHRAVDCTPDLQEAMEIIIDCGCTRILTSGGKSTGLEGIENIHSMAAKAKGRISIMPGGGIRPEIFSRILHHDIHEYHMSGRLPVVSSMRSDLFEMDWAETSEASVRKVVEEASAFFC